MVDWTDQERSIISSIFATLDYDDIGPKALCRHGKHPEIQLCLIVYPWTQRYFGGFGNLYNADAIKSNPNIAAHGVTVLHGLDKAVKNMDNIKNTYSELSVLHSEKLHVDPDNFRLLSDCLTIVIAAKMGNSFTPEIQAAWQKFLAVVVSALGRQYQ
ncbi:Hemoglobin subunit beta [Collichthys lucidus]|uniref:Hemoglobin subunit beta n=1 Tax=Collichthys lucidus TaxID=240159 RepID=A0A4U5VS30_COLLU|nr:Hemoglobin subunit beta [Collichthys lucidus]